MQPDPQQGEDLSSAADPASEAPAGQWHDRDATTAPSGEATGARLGPYKLLHKLGEGGMGAVWMAEQHEPVERRVAVKLIKAGLDSAQVVARFEAERQALALMDHPNIARVLDAGATPEGRPFVVMELVKGVPITAFCDQQQLSPRERLELFIPVCQAVQHAHQKGIIHRDLKPSNVLVALYDGRPVPKVIDFGVAKATGPRLTEKTLFTEVGQVVGTLEYMSPEQAELNNLDIDTRADVYSLGVLLYELLTGCPPFSSAQLRSAAFAEMLRILREEEPPKPSTKLSSSEQLPAIAARRKLEPRRLTRLVQGELDWITMKCLEKERSRRYETANGLALDLQRYLADELVLAGPPSAGYRLRKLVRRNKGPVLAATLVLLALLAGIAGTTAGLVRAEKARAAAEQAQQAEEERAEGERQARLQAQEAAEAERLAKEAAEKAAGAEKRAKEQAQKRLLQIEKGAEILASVFHDLDPRAEEKEGVSLRVLLGRRLEEAVKQLQGDAVGDPLVVARLQELLGNSLAELGHYEQAEVVLTKALRTQETSLGADHPDTFYAMHNLAALYQRQGKYARAEPLLKQVLAGRTAQLGADHPQTLTTKQNLAVLYKSQGKYRQAETLYKEVLEGRTARLGVDDLKTLITKHNLANLYQEQGKYPKAETLTKEVLDARTARLGADHPDTLNTKHNLALLYKSQGKYTLAEPLYKEVLASFTAKLGADHPSTLTTKANLAELYKLQGKHTQAQLLVKEVLAVQTATLGADHPSTLITKFNLARLYQSQGKYTQAETLFKEVLASFTAKLGADHPSTLTTKANLAQLYWSMKKLDLSIPLFEEVLQQRKKKLGVDHPETVLTRASLGVNYRDAGRIDDALRCLEKAVATIRSYLGPPPARLVWIFGALAETYDRAGRYGKSEPLYRSSLAQARKQFGNDHPATAAQMAVLGLNLLQQKKYTDAEALLRDCLALREKKQPDLWTTFGTRSMLGEALAGQKKYPEAEPLLLDGYHGMKEREKTIPPQGKVRLREALERLVQLYDAWGKKDKADQWRKKLEQTGKPAASGKGPQR